MLVTLIKFISSWILLNLQNCVYGDEIIHLPGLEKLALKVAHQIQRVSFLRFAMLYTILIKRMCDLNVFLSVSIQSKQIE